MQIHSNIIGYPEIRKAAQMARVDVVKCDVKGSRTRDYKFDINLEGESRRAPNQRERTGGKAATWDQWGVFLAVLFDIDPAMVCGSSEKYAYYNGGPDFHGKTVGRFLTRDDGTGKVTYWPADAHGDHTFKYNGVPREQACTKCSAVDRRY